jgi:hypothetical protein
MTLQAISSLEFQMTTGELFEIRLQLVGTC